jgi:tetratricopeptide (TPR) repeat protein
MYRYTIVVLLLVFSGLGAQAQFLEHFTNPTLTVTLKHPPGLGLKLDKVAFGPTQGECADLMVDSLISTFVSHGVEVLDRQNLQAILAEHDLTLGGTIDQASAAAIGRILGPSALVFIKAPRCDTEVDRLVDREKRYRDKRTYYVNAYISRTRAFLRASVQTVDLATGRIFAARAIESSPEDSNKSYDGYPEAPSRYDLLDVAIQDAVFEVHKMFLPWEENKELIYYNNNKCNLKQAFQYLQAGDMDGAFDLSLQNLDTCRNTPGMKPKIIAHAYYNVGMGYMMRDDYEQALQYFQEAARLRPGDITTRAMAECRKAQELYFAMQRLEERTAWEAEQMAEESERAEAEARAARLTNADVMEMARQKLPDTIIIKKIKSSDCEFDTSTEALVALTAAGVSEDVVVVMME